MVMVIVALAFIGILVGALLSAVGYSYRLKLQDLNARDNFYYVEQAMNEIYAGVGSQVVEDMKEAYIYTVENMVVYDFATNSYVTRSNDEVQEMFKNRFMTNVQNNPLLLDTTTIGDKLEQFITNDSVKLDASKIYLYTEPGTNADGTPSVEKVVIKNVTLTRTQAYDKSAANGDYTQTITTDIEIGEPDFEVLFNGINNDTANIFKFAMVADMGVEVNQPTIPLTITGNIYAAADYYNKKYNESMYVLDDDGGYAVSDDDKVFTDPYASYTTTEKDADGNDVQVTKNVSYKHGSVSSKRYHTSLTLNTYYNQYLANTNPTIAGMYDYYDGVNERSMYSGLFIDGSSVSILADMVIVPGTVAVMNEGNLALYGKDGKVTSEAELWTDNLVLGGKSDKKEVNGETVYTGAKALLRADAYVKDDTEINAYGASLTLRGSYYGYGDSTERDERVFVPTVDSENFQVEVEEDVFENRGHYNSSAIIVNGQQSTLDLSQTNTIYIAGRSYIELSKEITENEETVTENEKTETKVSETYAYMPTSDDLLSTNPDDTVYLRDYKTGESISLKTNQLAYIPVMYSGMPEAVKKDGVFQGYWEAELHVGLQGSDLFEKYFPESVFDNQIPCIMQEVSGKKYYYYDFETAYDMILNSGTVDQATFISKYASAQYYASAFIVDYVAELQNEKSVIKEFLTDIGDFEELEFEPGEILLPDTELTDASIYASGALTSIHSNSTISSAQNVEFSIVGSDDWDNTKIAALLSSSPYDSGLTLTTEEMLADNVQYNMAYQYSNDLELEYDIVKWNLGHYELSADQATQSKNEAEIQYIQSLVANPNYGDASITPINKFLNMDKIIGGTNIVPKINSGDAGTNVLDLASGYSVWVSYDDVNVEARPGDGGAVRGIVITKGDVIFDESVVKFEGLIVAGGKVYITNKLQHITASEAICESIIKECMLSTDKNAEFLLQLFKDYEDFEIDTGSSDTSSTEAKTIDNIDYSDVCRFSNWMKNVE